MPASMPTTPETHAHAHGPNHLAVLPTARRLDADTGRTGRGITIAFLDSGFYPHPDLTEPVDRIVAFEDVTGEGATLAADGPAPGWAWHGTQTSVVAAGNGRLSGGMYRGLACEARVALVKVGRRGRVDDESIVRGLEWVVANKDRYGIRVANLSLGGDRDFSYVDSEVDRAAEAAVRAGIVVVVAAGNSGCSVDHVPIPPANSPTVITVGGYDDGNRLDGSFDAYCSSFGPTVDGLLKPEVVAPAIWVAAPVLPTTREYARAAALSEIYSTPDALLSDLPPTVWRDAGVAPHPHLFPTDGLREEVARLLVEHKIVAAHYQHVDGTSFAAPIVASVVAQMLEANPTLTPAAVKSILVSTAERIVGVAVERQGYGMINCRRALELAEREGHRLDADEARPPYCDMGSLIFHFHDDAAKAVALAGDFNDWHPVRTPFVRRPEGIWRAEVKTPGPGRYRYKIVVDGARWLEDPGNGRAESDGYGGFNSVVEVRPQSRE
jgi:serine protease AprX